MKVPQRRTHKTMTGEQILKKAAKVRVRNMNPLEALQFEGRRMGRMAKKAITQAKNLGGAMVKKRPATDAQLKRVYMESGKRKRTP